MDKMIFVRKNDGEDNELSCECCVFDDICSQTEYNIPGFDCGRGDYWEIEECLN